MRVIFDDECIGSIMHVRIQVRENDDDDRILHTKILINYHSPLYIYYPWPTAVTAVGIKLSQSMQACACSSVLSGQRPSMLIEWKAFAKTGEGIYILQSTTDKFMWKLQTKHGLMSILKVVLNKIGNLPDTEYQIPTGYQISGRISGRSEYPVQPYLGNMIINYTMNKIKFL